MTISVKGVTGIHSIISMKRMDFLEDVGSAEVNPLVMVMAGV